MTEIFPLRTSKVRTRNIVPETTMMSLIPPICAFSREFEMKMRTYYLSIDLKPAVNLISGNSVTIDSKDMNFKFWPKLEQLWHITRNIPLQIEKLDVANFSVENCLVNFLRCIRLETQICIRRDIWILRLESESNAQSDGHLKRTV